MSSSPKAVIVTALPLEHAAICEHLTEMRRERHPSGTLYDCGRFLPVNGKPWDVIVVEGGPGNTGAALEFERAVSHYSPMVALFVGVAGGLKDVVIGDVVAGTKVYGYESGKDRESFQPRPAIQQSSYTLVQQAKAVARDGLWRARIRTQISDPPPQARVGPIAAGEKVIGSITSLTHRLLRENYGDALAVEMEGYGFLHAAYANQGVLALVVRGISDLIDGKTAADASGSQERAAKHASAFCFEVLAQFDSRDDTSLQSTPDNLVKRDSNSQRFPRISWFGTFKRAFAFLSVSNPTTHSCPGEEALNLQMDSVRTLLQDGHLQAAQSGLDRLQQQMSLHDVSPQLKVRLAINRGACYLGLEDYLAAESEFRKALAFEPGSQKALTNLAQVCLLTDRAEEARVYSAQGLANAPKDVHATGVHLRALDACGRESELRQLLHSDPWITDNSECCLHLALIAYDKSDWIKAEGLLRKALVDDSENAQILELLARTIVVPLQAALERNPPLPWKMDPKIRVRAEEAEELFRRTIDILSRQEYPGLLRAAVGNHGMVLVLLERYDEALREYDRVLGEDPDQPQVWQNKARLLLALKRPQEALACLNHLPIEDSQTAWRLHGVIHLAADQPRKALQVLLPLWDRLEHPLEKIRLADLLLEAYSDLGEHSKAQQIANSLRDSYPSDAEALAVVASWTAERNRVDEAVPLFYEALAHADPIQRDRITLNLADLYYRNDRFAEAAQLYQDSVDLTTDGSFLRRYLISLINSGSYQRALEIAQRIRGGRKAIPVVSDVEARLLEAGGDLAGAKRLLSELIEVEPDNPGHRVRLAFIHYRTGDEDSAKRDVDGISMDELGDDPDQLMEVAKVRAWLGLDGVLPLAYRARRIGFSRSDIHQAYVSLFLGRDKSDDSTLQCTAVVPGCAVHVRSNVGERRTYIVVDGLDADLHRGELLQSDPISQKLLGRSKGDNVCVKRTPFEEIHLEIEEVLSQYVFAFQDTLQNFSTWFPEAEGPDRLTANDEGITKVLAAIDSRKNNVEAALTMYRSRRLTLRMLGRLLGKSTIATWEALRSSDGCTVLVASGSESEKADELANAQNANGIVLDLSAILTLGALGHLDKLKRRFPRILVPQFVADEIRDELTLEKSGLRAHGWIGRVGDQYALAEAPRIRTDDRERFLNSLLVFLQENVSLMPALEALSALSEGVRGRENPLGRSSLAAILIAKRESALLYADDLILRVVARNDWQVQGSCSQNVLRELLRSGSLDEDDYHRAVADLILNRYNFTSPDDQDYYWFLQRDGWQVKPRFTQALRILEGPECSDHSAVLVVVEFLRRVWLTPPLLANRLLILDACVAVLKTGRSPRVILPLLEARARARFTYHPEALEEILGTLMLWSQEDQLLTQHWGHLRQDRRKTSVGTRRTKSRVPRGNN